ncbi:MAG: PilW family protein [Glaciimonas sp.]|nr:PilW family protein [Glaciimonas sp.]
MKTHTQFKRHHGFTLVELMISVTIGLVLLLFMSSLYFNSKASTRINDDSAHLQEDGAYALNLIGRNVMQAGYGKMLSGTTIDFVGQGITGYDDCTAGGTSASYACVTSLPSFTISYQTDDAFDSNTGAGGDCTGATVGAVAASAATAETSTSPEVAAVDAVSAVVVNKFFVAKKKGESTASLYCAGNGTSSVAQPILSNVDNLVLTYGVDKNGVYAPAQFLTKASDVNALTMSGLNKDKWDQVITVSVCVEIHSANNVTGGSAKTYIKCDGKTGTATDNKLHTSLTRVFTLRNRATPSLS